MRTGPREGVEPICPFCKHPLPRPVEKQLSRTETILSGRCLNCTALFIVDLTSKNGGEVMMQGLEMVAEELGRDLSTLVSGEDYEDAILSYDWRRHRSSGIPQSPMDGHGRLYIFNVLKKAK